MTFKVFVDGQEGTTGLKIFSYLNARPDIEILTIASEFRKDIHARCELANKADIVFLCLPDAASQSVVKFFLDSYPNNKHTCLIDTSTAFRTHLDWAYGLPELNAKQRKIIQASKKISVPGCHASAFILSVKPLIDAELIAPTHPIVAHSLTGYSGGGKKMIACYQNSQDSQYNESPQLLQKGELQINSQLSLLPPPLSSPRPYALNLCHKHLPEMQQQSGLKQAPIFLPIVANYFQGLAVTTYWHLNQFTRKTTLEEVKACLYKRYRTERFIKVLGGEIDEPSLNNLDDGFYNVQACNHTNRVDIGVFGNDSQIVVMARLDNLGKGASGAAIQCMNLALGVDENQGLKI